jgi:hypothetical protein
VLGNLAAGPLFIPALQMLASVFACGAASAKTSAYANTALCSGPAFAVQEGISVTLILLLFAFSLTFASVFFESHPLSGSLEAKAHGRADVLLLFVQAVLVLAVEIFAARIAFWLLLVLLGLGGAIWLGAFLFFLPHYSHFMNAANVSAACCYMWLFACLLCNNLVPDAGPAAAIMVYVGMPAAAMAG